MRRRDSRPPGARAGRRDAAGRRQAHPPPQRAGRAGAGGPRSRSRNLDGAVALAAGPGLRPRAPPRRTALRAPVRRVSGAHLRPPAPGRRATRERRGRPVLLPARRARRRPGGTAVPLQRQLHPRAPDVRRRGAEPAPPARRGGRARRHPLLHPRVEPRPLARPDRPDAGPARGGRERLHDRRPGHRRDAVHVRRGAGGHLGVRRGARRRRLQPAAVRGAGRTGLDGRPRHRPPGQHARQGRRHAPDRHRVARQRHRLGAAAPAHPPGDVPRGRRVARRPRRRPGTGRGRRRSRPVRGGSLRRDRDVHRGVPPPLRVRRALADRLRRPRRTAAGRRRRRRRRPRRRGPRRAARVRRHLDAARGDGRPVSQTLGRLQGRGPLGRRPAPGRRRAAADGRLGPGSQGDARLAGGRQLAGRRGRPARGVLHGLAGVLRGVAGARRGRAADAPDAERAVHQRALRGRDAQASPAAGRTVRQHRHEGHRDRQCRLRRPRGRARRERRRRPVQLRQPGPRTRRRPVDTDDTVDPEVGWGPRVERRPELRPPDHPTAPARYRRDGVRGRRPAGPVRRRGHRVDDSNRRLAVPGRPRREGQGGRHAPRRLDGAARLLEQHARPSSPVSARSTARNCRGSRTGRS